MARSLPLFVVLVVLGACDCEEASSTETGSASATGTESTDQTESSPPPPLPDPALMLRGEEPTPTVIRVVSESAPRQLDLTFGPASPFRMAVVGEALPALSLDQPDTSRWPRGCDCPCDSNGCLECEPPVHDGVMVGPDQPFAYEWNGMLRHFRTTPELGTCFDTLPATAGRYVLSVCTEGVERCAITEVTVPAPDGITIDLDEAVAPPACPLSDDVSIRAAATALDYMARARVPEAVRADCPHTALCLADDEVASRVDPHDTGCLVYAIPAGDLLDVVVQIAGVRYAHHLAADVTRTKGITYPPRRR